MSLNFPLPMYPKAKSHKIRNLKDSDLLSIRKLVDIKVCQGSIRTGLSFLQGHQEDWVDWVPYGSRVNVTQRW